jgi:hypothetical protein
MNNVFVTYILLLSLDEVNCTVYLSQQNVTDKHFSLMFCNRDIVAL